MTVIRAIILDFDGVLVESNEEKKRAFEDFFALYPAHRDAMMEYHRRNHSCPRMMKFEHYVYELMGRPGDTETVQKMARQFSELVVPRVTACPEVPGARAFLNEFSRQVPLYISSVTPQDELREIVHARGIGSYFIDVFGDPPYKKTVAIRMVMERERLLPAEVIFIGDAVSDYGATIESGVGFLGRDSGLPWDGAKVRLYCDLLEIANVVRERMRG